MVERYRNPRLWSGLAYILANSYDKGNHIYSVSYVWYEQEFSLCKTKAFRELYEFRAYEVFRSLDKSLTKGKTIRTAWNNRNELVITPDFLPNQ